MSEQNTSLTGILCVNKPEGFTSFDVIAKLRGMTRCRKIGHSGTLDPMATGVLPLFFGGATKAVDLLPQTDKAYIADFRLGLTTDTQDSTGRVLSEHASCITKAELLAVLAAFQGEIMQLPPMYSAVQVNGQRLYDLARRGVEVERTPRAVTIHELKLLSFDERQQIGQLYARCSKGTYIRTLCHDIGEQLGTGAIMTGLCRTEACGFTLDDCVTLDQIQLAAGQGAVHQLLRPVSTVFMSYPAIQLNETQSRMFVNGVKLDLHRIARVETGPCSVWDSQRRFLGLALPDRDQMELRILKLFFEGK